MPSRISRLVPQTYVRALNAAIARALAPLAIELPQSLPDWADEHFYLSPESSGVQGPWVTQAPQRGVMLLICNDDIREITIKKCARIGFTKILMAAIAYYTAHKPRNIVIYQPTDSDADEFVKDEINPMLRDVGALRSRMRGNPEVQGKGNTLAEKVFDSSILHIRGGKSARAYRRLTKDIVIYDELDGFDRDIEGTGDPVTLGDKRVTSSPFKKSIRGSTPEDAATSIIQATLDTARLVFEWHFACVHCAAFVCFKWGHLHWDDRDAEPYGACAKCGGIWHYTDLRELNQGGRWQTPPAASDQAEADELVHYVDADGQIRDGADMLIDAPLHVGLAMWSGWSPFITWRELRDEFLQAKNSQLKLKAFVNTRLGECWTEGERPGWESLHARREHYPTDIEHRIGAVTIGADVQDDRFEWQLTGWSAGEESWSLGYGRLFVKTNTPDAFDELYKVLNRPVRIGTRSIMPAVVAIDSGHKSDEVYRICRKNPRVFIPVKGSSDARAPAVKFPRKRGQSHRTYLTIVGVSQIKSLVYGRLLLDEGDGRYHWPVADDHGNEYFQQLVSEEKRTRYVKGHPSVEWWKPAGVGNEVLDCNVYAYAALRIALDYLGADLAPVAPPTPAPVDPAKAWHKRKDTSPWLRGR